MQYRALGNTGIRVSEIAFGGVEIGMPYGIGVHTKADMLSSDQAMKLLHEALENGINFFDTARLYGESEAIIGHAFQDRRKEVIIATKCIHIKNASGQIPAYQNLKKIIESSLQESCMYLKTDYIDVFMLHQADTDILSNEDVQSVFSGLKQNGYIRAMGASTYNVPETKMAVEKNWDVIQLPFNMLDQRHSEVFEQAKKNKTALIARSVLMKGLLSDKGKNLHPSLKNVEDHIKSYQSLLSEHFADISTLATKFVMSFQEISAVLIGIDHRDYLHKALKTLQGGSLSPSLIQTLKNSAYPDPEFLDLPKWAKLGWLR